MIYFVILKSSLIKNITLSNNSSNPPQKSFYIYRGNFIYSPCTPTDTDEIVWIVMEHPVQIHSTEYALMKDLNFLSVADNTSISTYVLNGRNVYYNNGEYVSGNTLPGQIYIKCTKKTPSTFSYTETFKQLTFFFTG